MVDKEGVRMKRNTAKEKQKENKGYPYKKLNQREKPFEKGLETLGELWNQKKK